MSPAPRRSQNVLEMYELKREFDDDKDDVSKANQGNAEDRSMWPRNS